MDFLITWKENGKKGWPHGELRKLIDRFEKNGSARISWRFKSIRKVSKGDRAFLLRQGGAPRTIFGVARVIGAPKKDDPGTGTRQWRVPIQFEKLVDPLIECLVPEDSVRRILPIPLLNAQASGMPLSSSQSAAIENYVNHLSRHNIPASSFVICWRNEPYKNFEDILPIEWFAALGKRRELRHKMRNPQGRWDGFAKCNLTVDQDFAELDYHPFEQVNSKKGAIDGVIKLQFTNSTRRRLSGVGWKSEGERNFDWEGADFFIEGEVASDLEEILRDPEIRNETTRKQLVNARLGQGQFRERLFHRWRRSCAVTGSSQAELLRASHIKPWKESDNTERLDLANGLLLDANLDALFDNGLISFNDDGSMILSTHLANEERKRLDLPRGLRLAPSKREKAFLAYHRKNVLRSTLKNMATALRALPKPSKPEKRTPIEVPIRLWD